MAVNMACFARAVLSTIIYNNCAVRTERAMRTGNHGAAAWGSILRRPIP